jgi:type I restriction enzyme M protein
MALTDKQRKWYYDQIEQADPLHQVVTVDRTINTLTYAASIRTDEPGTKAADPEELVHALAMCLLATDTYKYHPESFYHEKYYRHGSVGSTRDEVDLIVYDNDDLPFAVWEFKAADDYKKFLEKAIRYQLFGTAAVTV